jgi:uncharacterized iron-regulated membrane protein
MDFAELTRAFRDLLASKPGTIVLLCLGFILFLFLVVDTWRHRRRRKRPR